MAKRVAKKRVKKKAVKRTRKAAKKTVRKKAVRKKAKKKATKKRAPARRNAPRQATDRLGKKITIGDIVQWPGDRGQERGEVAHITASGDVLLIEDGRKVTAKRVKRTTAKRARANPDVQFWSSRKGSEIVLAEWADGGYRVDVVRVGPNGRSKRIVPPRRYPSKAKALAAAQRKAKSRGHAAANPAKRKRPTSKKTAKKTAKKRANPNGTNVLIQYENGRWGFVGNVSAELAYVTKTGKTPTDTQFKNAKHAGPRLAGLKSRSWATKTAAEAARKRVKSTRTNPGRLAILANPVPKAVADSAAKMRGEKRRRFLAYYASLKPGDQKRLVTGLQLYRKRHRTPCTDFELKKIKGTRIKIEVGVGKAQAIEYHANGKAYKGSSKRGVPFRHEFENGQHVVSDERGRKLEIVDRKGAKRKTVTTDWIYN